MPEGAKSQTNAMTPSAMILPLTATHPHGIKAMADVVDLIGYI